MMKGLSPGIAFVMLMAGPAANFASLIILGKSHGRKATAIYVASVAVTAIVFGLAIDLLLPRSWFAIAGAPLPAAMWKRTFSPLCAVLCFLRFLRCRHGCSVASAINMVLVLAIAARAAAVRTTAHVKHQTIK